jgi:hypothetical protein
LWAMIQAGRVLHSSLKRGAVMVYDAVSTC